MGAEEENKAGQAAQESGGGEQQQSVQKRLWWFEQPIPIDRFTGWLVTWTALLFTATVINAVVLYKTDLTFHDTLIEARKSADAAIKSVGIAREAADAAKASVDVSTVSAERQLRAYVSAVVGDIVQSGQQLQAHVTISNLGQTPAYKIVVTGLNVPASFPPERGRLPAQFGTAPVSVNVFAAHRIEGATFLGQGKEFTTTLDSKAFSREEFASLQGGTHRLWTVGAAYYTDVFGQARFVRFCKVNRIIMNLRRRTLLAALSEDCNQHNDAN